MRTRLEIERDLAEARSRLTIAEAGDRTDRVAYYAACAAVQREVQVLEQELATLPPVATAPVATTVGTTEVLRGTAGGHVAATGVATGVATERPAQVAVCPPEESFWIWVVVAFAVFGALIALWLYAQEGGASSTRTLVQAQQTPTTTRRTPVRTVPPKVQQPQTYRDCMFDYGERRELADGRCDHLQ